MSGEKGQKIAKKLYMDVAKRRQVNGSVAVGSVALALFTGRYTARSIIISNPDTATHWYQVLDGATVIIGKTNLSANTKDTLSDLDLPFYTSFTINSDSTQLIISSGGFVP